MDETKGLERMTGKQFVKNMLHATLLGVVVGTSVTAQCNETRMRKYDMQVKDVYTEIEHKAIEYDAIQRCFDRLPNEYQSIRAGWCPQLPLNVKAPYAAR